MIDELDVRSEVFGNKMSADAFLLDQLIKQLVQLSGDGELCEHIDDTPSEDDEDEDDEDDDDDEDGGAKEKKEKKVVVDDDIATHNWKARDDKSGKYDLTDLAKSDIKRIQCELQPFCEPEQNTEQGPPPLTWVIEEKFVVSYAGEDKEKTDKPKARLAKDDEARMFKRNKC